MSTADLRTRFILFAFVLIFPQVVFASLSTSPVNLKTVTKTEPQVTLQDLLGGNIKAPVTKVDPAAKVSSTATKAKAALINSSGSGLDTGIQNVGKTIMVDQRSGGAGVSVPLYLPEGRGGVTPPLQLTWSPTAGDGPFGFGWSMEMGSVVRNTKNGVPQYDSTDTFLVNLGGKSYDLVSLGNNEYRSKFDDDRGRFFFVNGVWSAKDKTGTTYYFGSRAGSTVNDGGSKVFKWKLDRIEDLFGNVLVADYLADESFEVRYGLKVGLSTTADVNLKSNFSYVIDAAVQATDRTDKSTSYKAGFAINENRLMSTLTITGGGNLLKKYNFAYAASTRTSRILLKTVTEGGADGTTTQPVVNIQYNDSAVPTYVVNSITDPLQGDNSWIPDLRQGATWRLGSNGNFSVIPWGYGSGDFTSNFSTYLFANGEKTISFSMGYPDCASLSYRLNGAESVSANGSAFLASLHTGYNFLQVFLFFYNSDCPGDFSFDSTNNFVSQGIFMNSSQAVYPQLAGDFNGDGKTDVATYFTDSGTLKVALSNGGNFLPKTSWIDNFANNAKLILGDFNGDGKTDIGAYDSSTGEFRVALSDGTKFVDKGVLWTNSSTWKDALTSLMVGELNGDGRSDIVRRENHNGVDYVIPMLNRGDHFESLDACLVDVFNGYSLMLADVNGDGLADIVGFAQSKGGWSTILNNGKGNFVDTTTNYQFKDFGSNQSPLVVDFNGDGKADIGYFDAANKMILYHPSIEGGFGPEQTLSFNFTLKDTATTQIQLADFNGDGILDYMAFDSMGRSDIAMSSGPKFNDLLTSYDNNHGGKVDIAYGTSADVKNKYLPFALPVVNSVTVSNGIDTSITSSYTYEGGYWDSLERELYGFKKATVTDALGNYAVAEYNQDSLYLRGHVDRTAMYDNAGKLLTEARTQWNNDPVIDGRTDVRFVSPKRVDNFVYDTTSATPSGVRTATESTYDIALGLPSEARDFGEVDWSTGADINNDYIRTVFTYGSNTATNVLGLLTSKIMYDKDNNFLAKSFLYYDGQTSLGSLSKGLVTRSDTWNKAGSVESLISTTNTYNDYGQLLTSKDPLNHSTSMTYDPTWSMFPLTSTNAKNFVRKSTYYGVNGEGLSGGLWGLPKSITDTNNQTLTSLYDAFGRVTANIGPLDSSALPSVTYEYKDFSNYRVLVTHRRIDNGQAAMLTTYAFVDGLGRTLAVKTPAATPNQFIVSGQKTLNNRGEAVKDYLPFLSSSDWTALEATDPSRDGASYKNDALGRRERTTFADGTYATFSYTPTLTTVIDPNGHMQKSYADARGRLIKKEEYTGADGRWPDYPQSAFNVYATTLYGYDVTGNLTSVTDAAKNVTTITYDKLGRKISMQDPDMGACSYGYDAIGNIISQTDAKGQTVRFSYDELGRPLNKTDGKPTGPIDNFPNLLPGKPTFNVAYNYDDNAQLYGKGRLGSVTYDNGTANFVYDPLGRETASSKTVDNVTYNVSRMYDALDRIKQIQFPDAAQVQYHYNAAGQVDSIGEAGSN